jgi:Spy/CpxP family protein refolding chaperone
MTDHISPETQGPEAKGPVPPVPPVGPHAGAKADGPRHCRGRRAGRKAVVMVALLGSFLAGGVVFSHMNAFSEDGPALMHRMQWVPGMNHFMPRPPTPEERLAHGREMLDRALNFVSATADQKTKILAIYDATAPQLKEAPVKAFQDRLALVTLLTAPTIDHAKVEALRAAAVSDIDGASKLLTKAIADAADVLDQSQRTRLAMFLEHLPPPPPPHGHGPGVAPPAPPAPGAAPAPVPAQ